MTLRRAFAFVVVLAVPLAGCGGPSMTPGAARELDQRVQAVRMATASGDLAVARAAIGDLRSSVDRLQRAGAIDDGKAADILAAASEVDGSLSYMPTTTTTTPPPPRPGPDHGPKGGKEKH